MNPLDLDEVNQYVNDNIDIFHARRLELLSALSLSALVEKNPYLFRAKNIGKASELVEGTMIARLSSSEEEQFGRFLEGLAIFIAKKTTGGVKSAAPGADLEFVNNGIHYIVSIKSGPSWGNSSQQKRLGEDLQKAVVRLKQGRVTVDSVLGICYGKTRTRRHPTRGYLKLVGQNFWTFISGNKTLYRDLIIPVGYRAKEHNDSYLNELNKVTNLLTLQFGELFCDTSGAIDWNKLVQANSGNFDLNKHGFDFDNDQQSLLPT